MNDKSPPPPPILTVPQLAKYAQTSPHTLYGLINDGSLAAFALNPESRARKNWRVYLTAWEAFVHAQKCSRHEPLP
jgi:hypothetical protein